MNNSIGAEAKGMMDLAQKRLLKEHPFHAGFVASWHVEADASLATAGVTIRNGTITMIYNPEFVVTCNLTELEGLLHHEINHILFGHIFVDREQFSDHHARIIAEECTVNEWITKPLPGKPITLEMYPQLPPDEDTNTRYKRLAKKPGKTSQKTGEPVPKTPRLGPKSTSSGPKSTSSGPKSTSSGPKSTSSGPKSTSSGPKSTSSGPKSTSSGPKSTSSGPKSTSSGPKSTSSGPKSTGSGPKTSGPGPNKRGAEPENQPGPIDDHGIWEEARRAGTLGRLAVKVAVATSREKLTHEEWMRIPAELRCQVERVCDDVEQEASVESIASAHRGSIDWRRVLRQHVRQAVAREPAYQRPPRRFPELVGIVPGTMRRPQKARVMAVIDTSGSISEIDLEQVSGELLAMSRNHEVIVVECDDAIQSVYPLTKALSTAHGRGGTDLRPPFGLEIINKIKPEIIVYFTDGEGPAPARPPRMPVIWCLAQDGTKPAPWGMAIQMQNVEECESEK